MKEFTITEEEHADLIKAYREMQNTPVIMVGKKHDICLADEIAKIVRDKMERLAGKYGYDVDSAKIMPNGCTFLAEPSPPEDNSAIAPPPEVENAP